MSGGLLPRLALLLALLLPLGALAVHGASSDLTVSIGPVSEAIPPEGPPAVTPVVVTGSCKRLTESGGSEIVLSLKAAPT